MQNVTKPHGQSSQTSPQTYSKKGICHYLVLLCLFLKSSTGTERRVQNQRWVLASTCTDSFINTNSLSCTVANAYPSSTSSLICTVAWDKETCPLGVWSQQILLTDVVCLRNCTTKRWHLCLSRYSPDSWFQRQGEALPSVSGVVFFYR